MAIHLCFLLLYCVLGTILPQNYLIILSILECVLAIISSIRSDKNYTNPYNTNLVALIIINIGNLSLFQRIANGTNIMYYFASVNDIPLATMIWCIGNSAFLIGYTFIINKKAILPNIGLKFNEKQTTTIFLIILFINQFGNQLIFLGSIAKSLYLIGVVGILFFARLWGSENKAKYRNYTLILFALQIYHALTQSYVRFEILVPIIILFVGYFTGKGGIRYIFSYRIIPFVIAIIAFINIFTILGKNRTNFGNAIIETYFTGNDERDDDAEDIYNQEIDRGGFFDRSSTLAQISSIVKLVNTNGFYNGKASEPLLASLIPRFLWPDKPTIALGQWFAIENGTAYVKEGSTSANNSINMTIPGELYLDFGWIAVVIGCFLFGAFIAQLWNTTLFFESNYNLLGSIFGGYLLFLALTGISVDLQIVITYISTYITFIIIKKIIIISAPK